MQFFGSYMYQTHSHKTWNVLQKGRIIMYDPKAGILTDEEIVSPD